MDKRLLLLPALVLVLQVDFVASRAVAQAVQKIAVLDLVAIRLHSLAGKSISSQFGSYRRAFQKDADVQQKRLKAAQNELRLQRSLLSPEAMRARERKFKDEVTAVQRRFQARKRALDKSRIEAFKVLQKNLTDILKTLRGEKKYDIIFKVRPAVIFADPGVDITAEVLKRINARLKKVVVKNPAK